MKLILLHDFTDGCTYGVTAAIPFEYSSIVDFQYMVLEKIEEHKNKCIREYGTKNGMEWYTNGEIDILDMSLSVGTLENRIENSVYTLEDWFERNKVVQKKI
jgi:hypothetical protein